MELDIDTTDDGEADRIDRESQSLKLVSDEIGLGGTSSSVVDILSVSEEYPWPPLKSTSSVREAIPTSGGRKRFAELTGLH
jgi:hypothetical protein